MGFRLNQTIKLMPSHCSLKNWDDHFSKSPKNAFQWQLDLFYVLELMRLSGWKVKCRQEHKTGPAATKAFFGITMTWTIVNLQTLSYKFFLCHHSYD